MTAHPYRMAHRAPIERSPYAFTLREYALCALAALVAAPLTYSFIVLFLTVLDAPR
jgi:hypothetical protein